MKAELIPAEGGEPIPITKDVTVMGRREYCDIQIDHPSLSKRHCVLVKTDGLLVIRDLATTNGTKVKGQKVRWAALLPDDKIALREYQIPGLPRPRRCPRPFRNCRRWREGRIEDPERIRVADALPGDWQDREGVIFSASASVPAPTAAQTQAPASSRGRLPADMDFVLPVILDEGAWRDALGPDSAEIPEIIDLD